MLAARNLSYSIGSRNLVDDTSVTIADDERVALLGKNGAGKSTLLSLLAGQQKQDGGTIERGRGQRLGFLSQEPHLDLDATVDDVVSQTGAASHRVDEALSRLGIASRDAIVSTLSGGQRRRLDLARLLLEEPDVLLLDEPTNHLDVQGIRHLGDVLRRHRGPVLVISHDRAFVDDVCTRVIELEHGKISVFSQPNDDQTTLTGAYLEQKLFRDDVQSKTQHKQQQRWLRELAWLRAGTPARTTKSSARIQSAHALHDVVETQAALIRDKRNRVQVAQEEQKRLGKTILDLDNLELSRGGRALFSGCTLPIVKGQRLGILGDNGVGKTSLITAIADACGLDVENVPEITAGKLVVGSNTDAILFDQHRRSLDPEATLQFILSGKNDHVILNGERVHVSSWLERFLFHGSDKDRRVKTLSGGEQNRLVLARMFLAGKNVLLLDEPTNDLDVDTLGVLEDSLLEHAGCAFIISHDRRFLDRAVTGILSFEKQDDGTCKIIPVLGDYTHYERVHLAGRVGGASGGSVNEARSKEANGRSAKVIVTQRKRSNKEQQEYSKMEELITTSETQRDTLRTALSDPALFRSDPARAASMNAELTGLDGKIEKLYARWSELSALLAP
jgi:ABC transport system ATP-binding/permease protein